MKEASELMGKMKGMGGGKGGFADIMKNMAQGLAGGKAKFNTGAFNRMEKKMAAKERMLFKMEQKRNEKEAQTKEEPVKYSLNATATPNNYVFKLDDEEIQETSTLSKSVPQVDIDALAREIEGVTDKAISGSNKKKSKKSKK